MLAAIPICILFLAAGHDGMVGRTLVAPKPKRRIVRVFANITPLKNSRAVLSITVHVKPGWEIASITQKQMKDVNGPPATQIRLKPSKQFRLAGSFSTRSKTWISRYDFWPGLDVERHRGKVVWTVPIQLTRGTKPQALAIRGTVWMTPEAKDTAVVRSLKFVARFGAR